MQEDVKISIFQHHELRVNHNISHDNSSCRMLLLKSSKVIKKQSSKTFCQSIELLFLICFWFFEKIENESGNKRLNELFS